MTKRKSTKVKVTRKKRSRSIATTVPVRVNRTLAERAAQEVEQYSGTLEGLVEIQLKSYLNVRVKLGLHDEFNFGKYQGVKVMEVLRNDPDYMIWLVKEQKSNKFKSDVTEAVDEIKDIQEDFSFD